MWYLKRAVLLTKDNLARRNWIGSKVCSFCNWEETIQHLFFDCAYARFFWRAIHLVFGLAPPKDVDDLFNHWLKQGGRKPNLYLLTGISAMCWVIWLSRNDVIFNICQPKTFFQVLFRERIGYAIGHSCSTVRNKRRDWFRHVIYWSCWLFVSSHPMDSLLVYGLAFNNNVVCFKIIVRTWCGCSCV